MSAEPVETWSGLRMSVEVVDDDDVRIRFTDQHGAVTIVGGLSADDAGHLAALLLTAAIVARTAQ